MAILFVGRVLSKLRHARTGEFSARIADTLSGGAIDRGTPVDENWLYALERKHFVELARMGPTQERIVHMLKTGKPLRN